jgi:plastocyanin
MKKNYLFLFVLLFAFNISNAAVFTIMVSGLTYSPSVVNAAVGDTILFTNISGSHPTVQVSQTTWNMNGSTPLPGGWGSMTSNFQYIISAPGDIYYVCSNHVSSGMKGRILVTASNVAELIGENNISILSNVVNFNEIIVMNTTGSNARLYIYDLSGKEVSVNELNNSLRQLVTVDLPSGVYLYRFNINSHITPAGKLYINN